MHLHSLLFVGLSEIFAADLAAIIIEGFQVFTDGTVKFPDLSQLGSSQQGGRFVPASKNTIALEFLLRQVGK